MGMNTTRSSPRCATAFLPAAPCSLARCTCAKVNRPKRVHLSAPGGFHRDSPGAGAPLSTGDMAPASSMSRTGQVSGAAGSIVPTLLPILDHLRAYANTLAQYLSAAGERSSSAFQLGRSLGSGALDCRRPLGRPSGFGDPVDSSACQLGNPVVRPLHLPLGACGHQVAPLPPEVQHQNADDGHLWAVLGVMYLPWSHRPHSPDPDGSSGSHLVLNDSAVRGGTTTTGAASAPASSTTSRSIPPGASPSMLMLMLLGPSALQAAVGARLTALALLWRAAVSVQQRATVATLWHVGQVLEAAERARRSMPPPQRVPELMHWGVAAAAVHAEESMALALAHTATAASAAAAGVPGAAAVLARSTAAAAAAAAVAAPHLPVLRHARSRLLAAAKPLLEQLHSVRRGCTTHVLLRFLLFSSLSPGLRRELLIRLDIMARRATQLALLQEQHDAWTTRQPALEPLGRDAGSTPSTPSSGTSASNARSKPTRKLRPLQGASSGSSSVSGGAAATQVGRIGGAVPSTPPPSSSPSATAALSSRWYRNVFALEMRACARQLRCEARGSPPDDWAAGDPPGRFDLRDLYRLIRVVEVAVEDLERYA